MRKWIIAAFLLAALAGCASTADDATPTDDKAATATTPGGGSGATTSGATTSGVPGGARRAARPRAAAYRRAPSRTRRTSCRSATSISTTTSSWSRTNTEPIVEAHAKYLQANRSARAILQGNTDERGTREYNIALGQKRADAVKNMMLLLGATEIQIETVSFGKEKPRREGHDEASWAENRRVDIVHAGE